MNTPASILVIDDEPDNFDVVETLLDGENYQLHYAANGLVAIERLKNFRPDLILLDVMMPNVDGMEVCRRIKADPQWEIVPIIMVTALTAKEDLAKCMAAGADDFISKPINSTELRARVNSMLRIKQQYDKLQALLKLQEDMVNMIVHDLRNPLSSIVLATEVLKYSAVPQEKLQMKMSQIGIACQQLQTLIDSLLIMAKLDSGKMVLNYSDVDLAAICTSAIADMEEIAGQKHLTLVRDLPEVGGTLKVDAAIFRRVLDNLLSNAIKFSPSRTTIILRAEYLETGAKVQVIDSGTGIPQELRESIFHKFEVGNLISGVSQLGLGLAFCKMAIDAHNGNITIEDNYPKGTIFTVYL